MLWIFPTTLPVALLEKKKSLKADRTVSEIRVPPHNEHRETYSQGSNPLKMSTALMNPKQVKVIIFMGLADQWPGQILRRSSPNEQSMWERYFWTHLFDFNKLVKKHVGGDERESPRTVDISINSAINSLTLMLNNSTCKWEQWFTLRQAGIRDLDSISRQKKEETSPWKVLDLRHYCNTSILDERWVIFWKWLNA